jgi:hypothetical protein
MLAIPSIRYNSGRKPTGAKLALKPVHVWGIRIRLQVACKARDLALFDSSARSTCRLTSAMGGKRTLLRRRRQSFSSGGGAFGKRIRSAATVQFWWRATRMLFRPKR